MDYGIGLRFRIEEVSRLFDFCLFNIIIYKFIVFFLGKRVFVMSLEDNFIRKSIKGGRVCYC